MTASAGGGRDADRRAADGGHGAVGPTADGGRGAATGGSVRHRTARVACVAGLALAGCAPDGGDRFATTVAPVLEARCAATFCHGVAPDAEARGEVVDWTRLHFRVDARGRLTDVEAARAAAKRAANTDEAPEFSTLLRKPLPAAWGGLPHHGGANFASPDDPAYVALRDWIAGEDGGGESAPPLDARERLFAETVQPALVSGGCTNANCHGVDAAVPYRLDPGLDGVFPRAATRANYAQSLTMLSLDGDPSQSRLLRKALPLHAGGVLHKGGNGLFSGRADPRPETVRRWACAEREARFGRPCDDGAIEGFVFVRGPLPPHGPFALDTYAPGTALYWAHDLDDALRPRVVERLTDASADARDPAVDPSGRRVAFAMRTSAEGGHDLYELELATRAVRRLTSDAGGGRTYRHPTYGPDGHLWFVSTREGVLADGGDVLDADLYEMAGGEIVRRTFTPHAERKPVFLVHGEENGGEIAFTALREAVPAQRRAHPFRFPPDLATEYHQHFGITPPEDLFDDVRELPDGRYVMTIGALDGVWRAGRLGVVDRNFGPEMPEGAPPGLPFYAPPLTRLDPDAAASGTTRGLYRDAAPLPDGRLLVAYAPETVDLADPAAAFDLRIEVLTLEEAVDGGGPRIAARWPVVDAVGTHDFDPEPVYARQPAPAPGEPQWDPAATTGLFVHHGLPVIDALLGNLPPSGPKAPRTDIRGARLVEALPSRPSERAPVPPEDTPDGRRGASSVGLGRRGAARVLAEVPVADDGTFQIAVPPGVAFRVQALDADGMAVGTMHNRWYALAPGQTLVQGTSPAGYAQRCAPCHGAADGDPAHVFVAPDVLTMASQTLGRYEGGDPRRPLPVPVADASTRIEVDFSADVRPILERRCGCHTSASPAAGLDLARRPTRWFDAGYERLLAGDLVDEETGSARRSFLVEKLTGRELDAPRALDAPGIAHGDVSADELRTIVRWIDLGANFRGRP